MTDPVPDPSLRRVGQRCLARQVRQLARELSALYDGALRPHGLRTSQMNLLVAVGAMGEARPGDLQGTLSMEKSTVSRNAERLVLRGWLLEYTDGSGRNVSYRLSPVGRRLLERALPAWELAQAEARRLLGSEGVEALGRLTGS